MEQNAQGIDARGLVEPGGISIPEPRRRNLPRGRREVRRIVQTKLHVMVVSGRSRARKDLRTTAAAGAGTT